MRLIDECDTLADARTYPTRTTGNVAPDRGFDYTQVPTRRGPHIQMKPLDGSQATVRRWDGMKRQWRFAKLGQRFYYGSQDTCAVTLPAIMTIARIKGSGYKHDTVAESNETALDTLRLTTLMPEAEQLTEVKRRVAECLSTLETDEELRKILIRGEESTPENELNPERDTVHNREEIAIRQDGTSNVTPILHRPLRTTKPWAFGSRCVSRGF
jgi:hypothetical protein